MQVRYGPSLTVPLGEHYAAAVSADVTLGSLLRHLTDLFTLLSRLGWSLWITDRWSTLILRHLGVSLSL